MDWQKRVLAVLVVIAAVLGAGTAFWANQQAEAGQNYPRGTWVAGQDLSQLNQDDAALQLDKLFSGFAEVEYQLNCPSLESHSIKAQDVGASLDTSGFLAMVMARESERNLWDKLTDSKVREYPLEIPIVYDNDKYYEAMAEISPEIEESGGIARVQWNSNGIPFQVSGQERVRIDREATLKALPKVFKGEKQLVVNVATVVDVGQIDPNDIQKQTEMGRSITWFNAGNINRSSNLKIAAQALNGVIIMPDQVFSFNTAVGPRELSTGYKEALVILQNEFTPGIGGGICQVSSTLYNAVLMANLEIVERYNHSVAVDYVPTGLDATVVYKSRDFRFKNNFDFPIFIKTTVQSGKLNVQIMGQKEEPKLVVKLERQVLATIPFKEVFKDDPELLVGQERVDHNGVNGYRVVSYRDVYDVNGQRLSREKLGTDYYKPLDKLILVGTKAEPPGEDPPIQEPPDEELPPIDDPDDDPPDVIDPPEEDPEVPDTEPSSEPPANNGPGSLEPGAPLVTDNEGE
ncbi:MAG: hypothetical protein GX825_07660 [Syntrophomonadaceae bacterium]|nr:hypothetical protein [Syntrophomonadaceae bacterium]